MNEARAVPAVKDSHRKHSANSARWQAGQAGHAGQRFGEHQKPAANFMNVSNYICNTRSSIRADSVIQRNAARAASRHGTTALVHTAYHSIFTYMHIIKTI